MRYCRHQRAFTLIEIMVVVAIIGIVMSMAVPSIYRHLRPPSMDQAVTDIMDACKAARAAAIFSGKDSELVIRPGDGQIKGGEFSAKIPEKVRIELLDVNFVEYKEAESAHVRFAWNGTSDEFTIVLHSVDKDEWRKISLEVVTGLPDLETDPSKFLH